MENEEQVSFPQTIRLTPEAASMARHLETEDPERKGKALRLYLEGKGCDGFYYGVTFDDPLPGDMHFLQDGVDVVIDSDAFQFCSGSEIEWVDDERGRGFLVNNPRHRKFRGKFYKRKSWQERLEAKRAQGTSAEELTSSGEPV